MMKFNQPTYASARIGLVLAVLFAAFSVQAQVIEAGLTAPDARFSATDEQGRNVYLIEFAEPGLMEQHRQQRRADEAFSVQAAPMQAALSALQSSQQQRIQSLNQMLGRSLEVSHHYLVTHSGIAARLTPTEAAQVSEWPGVTLVERERVYEINTFRGPEFIGAGGLWDGSASPSNDGLQGEGMVAAIIDTGIVINHPSFANDVAECGHGVGEVGNKLRSALDCATTNGAGMCNGPNPHDTHSHGSHVSSTVAGNRIDSSVSPPPVTDISGVAPCAHVRSYNSCPGGSCPGSYTQAAMNSILLHGDVDVMNYSISGGRSPWNDNDRRKLDLVDAGIFVAASAGNTSSSIPNPYGQVAHLGPWLMSVANSSHDGLLAHPMSLTGGPDDVAGLPGTGPELTTDLNAALRWAGDVAGADVEGCSAFPPGSFNDEAALIIRGNCDFATKVTNASNAGADFVVIYNNVPGGPIVMGGLEPTTVPSVMVSLADGQALIDALDGGTASLTVLAGLMSYAFPGIGDILSGGSLVGPTPVPLHNLQKPDITAPGTSIYAAGTAASGYTYMSGTSMSSPHLAGAAVLMHQARPDWSPVEVKSALQMTASGGGFKPGGTDPWDADDVGHGRTQVSLAANAGLVMDETFDNFLAANPSQGGDVRTLNLPALRDMDCSPSCSWTRTVRNTLDTPSNWTASGSGTTANMLVQVSPSSFSFSGDSSETQELTITVAPLDDLNSIGFGEIIFSEGSDSSPDLHFTVAIQGEAGIVYPVIEVDQSGFEFLLNPDSADAQDLTISNTGIEVLDWTIDTEQISTRSALTDFVGDFDLTHWELVNTPASVAGSVSTTAGPPGEVLVLGGDVGVGGTTDFQIEVPEAGTIHFDWGFQSEDDYECADSGGYAINGDYTTLACNDQAVPHFSESASAEVSGGDLFAFRAATDDGLFGAGELGVTGFVFEPLPCTDPGSVPWLSVTPDAGSTAVGGDSVVSVEVDTAGLADGTYEANLCISSNDPFQPVVAVPVSLRVISGTIEPPTVDVDPANLSFDLISGYAENQGLTVSNLGHERLNWEFADGSVPANCDGLSDISWLSATPVDGSLSDGQSTLATVSVDAAGLAGGSYQATLCVLSNDPANAVTEIAIDLSVTGGPEIEVDPTGIAASVTANSATTESLIILNQGESPLEWSIHPLPADLRSADESQTGRPGSVASSHCATAGDVSWLSVDPAQGATEGGESSPVEVLLDASGLSAGSYEAVVCISSNDLGNPAVDVPVSLEVLPQDPAVFDISTTALDFGSVAVGNQATAVVTVSNLAAVGAKALELGQIAVLVGAPTFALSDTDCGSELEPQHSCDVEVGFAPSAVQGYGPGVLRIVADGQPVNVTLIGSGEPPVDPIFDDRFEPGEGD